MRLSLASGFQDSWSRDRNEPTGDGPRRAVRGFVRFFVFCCREGWKLLLNILDVLRFSAFLHEGIGYPGPRGCQELPETVLKCRLRGRA